MKVKKGGRYEQISTKIVAFLDTPELARAFNSNQKTALTVFQKLEKEFVDKGNLKSPTEQLVDESTKVEAILERVMKKYKDKAYEEGRSKKEFDISKIIPGHVSSLIEREVKDSWKEGQDSVMAVKLSPEFEGVALGGKKRRTKRRRNRRKTKSSRRA